MTLREYILRWQEAYDKNQSRPTTYAAHGYLFKNHILPGLGEYTAGGIDRGAGGRFSGGAEALWRPPPGKP